MRTTPCANSAYADPSPSPVSKTCRKFVMTDPPLRRSRVAQLASRCGLRVVLVAVELLGDVQQLLVDDELLSVPPDVVVPGVGDTGEQTTEDVAGLVRCPRRHQAERVDPRRGVHRFGDRLAGDGVRVG